MRNIITTKRDLRNWVDSATTGWAERTSRDVEVLTDLLQADDHPAWGTDWSDWLDNLPELSELLLDAERQKATEL